MAFLVEVAVERVFCACAKDLSGWQPAHGPRSGSPTSLTTLIASSGAKPGPASPDSFMSRPRAATLSASDQPHLINSGPTSAENRPLPRLKQRFCEVPDLFRRQA